MYITQGCERLRQYKLYKWNKSQLRTASSMIEHSPSLDALISFQVNRSIMYSPVDKGSILLHPNSWTLFCLQAFTIATAMVSTNHVNIAHQQIFVNWSHNKFKDDHRPAILYEKEWVTSILKHSFK